MCDPVKGRFLQVRAGSERIARHSCYGRRGVEGEIVSRLDLIAAFGRWVLRSVLDGMIRNPSFRSERLALFFQTQEWPGRTEDGLMDRQRVIEELKRLIRMLLAEGARGFVIISEAQLRELLGLVQHLGPELDGLVHTNLSGFAERPDGARGFFFISEARLQELLEMVQHRLDDGLATLDDEKLVRLVERIEAVHASVGETIRAMRDALIQSTPAP